jgi:hypothetical protein
MSHKALLLSDVLTLVCVASELLLFGDVIAHVDDPVVLRERLICAIPALVFGLPIVVGVSAVRHARGGQMTWAGFELLGVFCLFLSRQILTGLLAFWREELAPVGLLASPFFTFSIAAKTVQLVVLIGRAWQGGEIDSIGRGVDLVIDGLNGLSLGIGMFTTVFGQAVFDAAPFVVSPTAAIGATALIAAGFLRRTQMRDVILVDVFGSLCLLTTWWRFYCNSVQRISILEWEAEHPVHDAHVVHLCLLLSAPFLFLVLCKFACLAVAFARGRRWTQYTLAGILIFFAACGPLCFAAWRVGK